MFATLCTMDLDSGTIEKVLETDRHIEAPNWSRDGGHLLVNADGQLYRIDLPGARMQPVPTGACTACNNDHGFSPDGSLVAFSDSALTCESCVYVMPAAGGTPRRVTGATPSWWHGWAPDGGRLAYTARRGEDFGICTIPVAGGAETIAITGGGHYDGPDYSPDGQWIWFNSDRGGSMDLWRMRPNGSDAEQMTGGTGSDWFPHPSPNGRNVVYLCYPAGTTGHPFGRNVELRLCPAEGGAPEVLHAFWGGQGSLNVPNWAPDGRRFAFVSYARPR